MTTGAIMYDRMTPERCLNVNVGVLGHVDCGKTSLVERLSTVLSTAAIDKHPQSQERGITLDLGFSALKVPAPEWLQQESSYDTLQFTLVDCPGHASLIKTVLGGAHIMDLMLLVVDITKGIQVQTAECIVIDGREKILSAAKKRVMHTLKLTSFKDVRIATVSATTGDGLDDVRNELKQMMDQIPERKTGPFHFAIDHCFRIKGQGTVLTGTVLQGAIKVQDSIEIPALQEVRRVKSIQVFKEPVSSASAGDRAGICVTDLDPIRLERGLAVTPGTVHTFQRVIVAVKKVKFFAGSINSRHKLQVMIGHTSSVGKFTFFKARKQSLGFRLEDEYQYVEELPSDPSAGVWALIKFDSSMIAPTELPLVAARLDGTQATTSCRMALHGKILETFRSHEIDGMKLFKVKERQGFVKGVLEDGHTVICSGMFKKETDFSYFIGLPVLTKKGQRGKLQKPYGRNGDVLVHFQSKVGLDNDKDLTLYSKKYVTP